MKITVITLFPKMIQSFIVESIIKRAQEKRIVTIEIINLRDYAIDSYGSVDDRPYGGGAGMVMRVEPIVKAISKIKNKKSTSSQSISTNFHKSSQISPYVVLTSPRGKVFNQLKAIEYSQLDHLLLIAGHYEGVDERVSHYIDEEISIGDFVMTGGEIAIAAIIDSVVRLLPGTLNKNDATKEESFMEVDINELVSAVGEHKILRKLKNAGKTTATLLEYPHYTRPEDFYGLKVPKILLSGDPKKIKQWRLSQAFKKTVSTRKDLLF